MDSTAVLTSLQSSVKQPLLDDPTIDSTSLRTRVEMRKQYKRRFDKSRLTATSAAYNFSAIDDDQNDDVEDRQGSNNGYSACDKLSLDAATSDTDLVTSSEQRTRSQSLDEHIISRVSSGNTFPQPLTPNNILHDDMQQQNEDTIIDSPLSLPPKPPSAVWSESHSKREERRNNNMRTPSPNKPPVSRIRSTRPKPKMKRNSTVPTTTTTDELSSTVADDVLMDRALNIRENLRQYEMQELAAEAERAAESGMEKYVGSASKYVEESPIQTPTNGSERKQYYPQTPLPFTNSVLTPQRSKGLSRGLSELDLLEFTPFSSTKKIRVTSLRNFSDVVPNFSDMHDNIRLHLERRGVDSNTLPEMGSRREQELMKNDTIESDAHSQAPSVTSGSVASFSSFATSSFKGMAELLGGRSRSNQSTKSVPKNLSINNRSASSARTTSFDGEKNQLKPLWEPADEEERHVDKSASVDHKDFIKARRSPPLFPPVQKARSAEVGNFRSIAARESPPLFASKNDNDSDGDSDDSSVELYGRKTPLNIPADNSLNSQHQQLKPALSSRQRFPPTDNNDPGPSNKINVSFVEDPLGLRSCSTGLLETSETRDTSDETGTVLSIFDRIQKQFSVSADNFQLSKKKTQEDNNMFVSNYFYTEKDDIIESGDLRNLKIEINPRNEKAFCGDNGNCGNDDTFVSSCGMLGEMVTSALEWVNGRKSSDATVFSNRSEATGFSNLYSTTSGHDTHTEKRIFLPPRLSERSCQGEVKGVPENDLMQQPEDNDEFCVDEKWLCDGIDLNRESENSSSSNEEARMA